MAVEEFLAAVWPVLDAEGWVFAAQARSAIAWAAVTPGFWAMARSTAVDKCFAGTVKSPGAVRAVLMLAMGGAECDGVHQTLSGTRVDIFRAPEASLGAAAALCAKELARGSLLACTRKQDHSFALERMKSDLSDTMKQLRCGISSPMKRWAPHLGFSSVLARGAESGESRHTETLLDPTCHC